MNLRDQFKKAQEQFAKEGVRDKDGSYIVEPTAPAQPPAPLAGGTELPPSTAPAEVAAGRKEGRPVSPASIGGDETMRPLNDGIERDTFGEPVKTTPALPSDPAARAAVSPATGEREAELRAVLEKYMRGDAPDECPLNFWQKRGVEKLLAALTPLLDRREGELAALRMLVAKLRDALESIPPCDVSMDASFVYKTSGWKWADAMQKRAAALALTMPAIADELTAKDARIKELETLAVVRWNTIEGEERRIAAKDAEIARINEIVSHPATLRRHVQKLFPEYRWEHPEYISRLEEAAQRVDAAESCARVCRQDAEINATRAEKADTALREAEAARGEDSKRLDWLEKIATDGEDARSIEMEKEQPTNKRNHFWSWPLMKLRPVGKRVVSLEWHRYSSEIRAGQDEEYGGHWDIRGVEAQTVRGALDAARAQEARP